MNGLYKNMLCLYACYNQKSIRSWGHIQVYNFIVKVAADTHLVIESLM